MARVLIVEDDLDTSTLLALRLREYGHVTLQAQSGRLALRSVGFDFPVDLALLDIDLHGMNGFDLLEELRRHPELDKPHLPAVFVSGSTSPDDVMHARRMGATFLTKPFISGELQGAILHALNAGAHV
jgi:DNA-binding response OmpR family regulator